ncbi:MAG TPA: cyclophilin-like fold protein [Prolixibacteraceae bacterium]|nr:cyclophilin-like fold protein [Prolixibacteraceae bacterium]
MNAQETTKIKITVGTNSFIATTSNNATAQAFVALLPLTVIMSELNGNEKFYQLSNNLPAEPELPSTIRAGDLMLYGQNILVLFYETFTTSYSYTKIGVIDDPAGLKSALGTGNPTVTFERMGSTTGIGSIDHPNVDFNISSDGLLHYTGNARKITLIDINGKVVASSSSKAFRINDFPKGVYILKVEEPGQTKTIKIKI